MFYWISHRKIVFGAYGGSRVSTLFDSEKGEIRRNDTRDEILSLWLQCVCKGENSYKELILFVTFVAIAFVFITQRIFSNVHTWKILSVLQASHVLCNVCDTRYRRKDCWVREMVTSTHKNWAKNCFLSWTVIDLNSSGCESRINRVFFECINLNGPSELRSLHALS